MTPIEHKAIEAMARLHGSQGWNDILAFWEGQLEKAKDLLIDREDAVLRGKAQAVREILKMARSAKDNAAKLAAN